MFLYFSMKDAKTPIKCRNIPNKHKKITINHLLIMYLKVKNIFHKKIR